MTALTSLDTYNYDSQRLTLHAGSTQLVLRVLAPDLVHLQVKPGGQEPRPSVAVIKEEWDPCTVHLTESDIALTLKTEALTVQIQRTPLQLRFYDQSGRLFLSDAAGISYDQSQVTWEQQIAPNSHYYGFGQKVGFLDKRGKQMALWTTDEPLHTPTTDLLYQAIPFHLVMEEGQAYGIFLDSTAKVEYDLGKTDPDIARLSVSSGALDAYIFTGPSPKSIIARYTELTGRMYLPPKWALGYQQCRWSYYPESRVREIATNLRERKIPADVIYLDIDYMDGYRVFTWDQERFPNPKQLIDDLAAQGFKVVTIVDPGVKVDEGYRVFQEGVEEDHFVQYPNGDLFIGPVWPGDTAFPDFTRERTRRWWGDWHQKAYLDNGIAGIWNDMNEPSCFARNTFPDEVLQGEDHARTTHDQVHNSYGFHMSQATYEGLTRLQPEKRPFIVTRSGYAGIQRYAAVWMGDNHSWWEHLLTAMPMCMGMGISGVPFVGTDVGGFSDDSSGELVARWTQLGTFTPFFRNHSARGTRDQEPWAFGPEVEAICRKYIELRYRFLPFMYNVMYEASQTGLPVMRPLLLEYPGDSNTHNLSDQFLVGRDLLVAPVYQPGAAHRMVYFPEGTWVDYWSGERITGPAHQVVAAPLDHLPLFIREGAIIPLGPVVQHTGEAGDQIDLMVIGGKSGELDLYEDDGESTAYLQGEFALSHIRTEENDRAFHLEVSSPEGRYRPQRERISARIHVNRPVRSVAVNGKIFPVNLSRDGAILVEIPAPQGAAVEVTLQYV